MASNMGSIFVDITANLSGLRKNLQTAQQNMRESAQKMTSIGTKMSLGVTLPLTLMGKSMITAASDMEESLNKVDVAFKSSSEEVKAFAKTTLESFGIAEGSALDMMALFGDMATGMNINTQEASSMAQQLTGLAGDLASFKNIRIDVAQTALKGIFTGETASLMDLGISIRQADVAAWALTKGINANFDSMSEAQKATLRYNYILDRTKNAQGDFARTSDGAANSTRIYQETLKELSAELGKILLPIFTKVVKALTKVAKWFRSLNPNVQKVILVVAGLAAAIGPLLLAVGAVMTALPALSAILGAIKVAFVAVGAVIAGISGPVWLAIGVIGALVAAITILWKKSENFRTGVKAIWDFILLIVKQNVNQIIGFVKLLTSNISTIIKVFKKIMVGDFKGAWDEVKIGVKNGIGVVKDTVGVMMNETTKTAKQSLSDGMDKIKSLDLVGKIKGAIFKPKLEKEVKKEGNRTGELAVNSIATGINDSLDKLKDSADKVGDAISEALEKRYEKQGEIARKGLEDEISMIEIATRKKIRQYDKELAAKLSTLSEGTKKEVSEIQKAIDAINAKTEAEEKELAEQEYQTALAAKKKARSEAKSADERERINAEMSKMILARERRLLIETRNKEKQALREKIEDIRNSADEEAEELRKMSEKKKKAALNDAEIQKSSFKIELEETKKHYEDLLKEENIRAEAQKMIIQGSQDDIITLLGTYNRNWQTAGESFGDSLLKGLQSKQAAIKSMTSKLAGLAGAKMPSIAKPMTANISSAGTKTTPSRLPARLARQAEQGGRGVTVNVTGNTFSDKRDVDKMMTTVVRKIRMAGV